MEVPPNMQFATKQDRLDWIIKQRRALRSLEDIGKELGISRERVRQLLVTADPDVRAVHTTRDLSIKQAIEIAAEPNLRLPRMPSNATKRRALQLLNDSNQSWRVCNVSTRGNPVYEEEDFAKAILRCAEDLQTKPTTSLYEEWQHRQPPGTYPSLPAFQQRGKTWSGVLQQAGFEVKDKKARSDSKDKQHFLQGCLLFLDYSQGFSENPQ